MLKNPLPVARKFLDRLAAVSIERASLLRIVGIFFVLVFVFAGVFWWLALFGDVVRASGTTKPLSVFDALYFSIVTISSLGYGDLAPLGLARVVACAEVLIGLSLMGVLVAKLSSARIGFHVRRLYATDVQERLNSFVLDGRRLHANLTTVMALSGRAFAPIPNATPDQQQEQINQGTKTVADFDLFLTDFRDTSARFYEYLQYELEHGDFFQDAPRDPIGKVGETISQITFLLAQLIISLPPAARVQVFQPNIRARLNEGLRFTSVTCDVVAQHCSHQDIVNVYSGVKDMTDRVPQELFNVPTGVPLVAPDQVLPSGGEPQ